MIRSLVLLVALVATGAFSYPALGASMATELKFPIKPLPLGALGKPTSGIDPWDQFTNQLAPNSDAFTGVKDPLGSGEIVVQNINRSGQPDNHTTVGTRRDLPKGSTSYCAFKWLWMSPAEFTPSGWSLVWQLQMKGSPIAAISNDQKTLRWFLNSRDGTISTKYDLGPMQYGHWMYFVVGVHLDDRPGGMVEVWMAADSWPNVSLPPKVRRTGHQTWQGETGHQTMGIYASHGKADVYKGYFLSFGRASTAQRAIDIAR